MEGEAPPPERHLGGLGARLERAERPAPRVRQQLLAADLPIAEAGVAQQQVAGRPGRTRGRRPRARARDRTRRPPRRQWPEWRPARRAPAARRLASGGPRSGRRSGTARRRRRGCPGPQHAVELAERATEVGDVVKDRVTEHQVEGAVGEREGLGLGHGGRHLEAQVASRALEGGQHPGRDVRGGQARDGAGLEQVQPEVAGAGADLQRVRVRAGLAAERLAQLRGDLVLPDLAEVDPPLRVVRRGRRVVIAGVHVLDVLGGRRGRGGHEGPEW